MQQTEGANVARGSMDTHIMKNVIQNIENNRLKTIRINKKKMFRVSSASNKILSKSIDVETKDDPNLSIM